MNKNNSFWIIKPLNKLFWTITIILSVLVVGSSILLKDASIDVKRTIIVIYMAISFIVYWLYKFGLSKDKEYDLVLKKDRGFGFTWWDELPLHLCNVNLVVFPLGVILNSDCIMAASISTMILGALMALLMPSLGFEEGSIFLPKMWGFYGFHFLLVFGGIMGLTYGVYVPKFVDVLPSIIFLAVLAFIVFIITALVRKFTICKTANYFYTFSPATNLLLQMVYKLIPVPYLYILPVSLLFGGFVALLAGLYILF